jgi:hypothetical protein
MCKITCEITCEIKEEDAYEKMWELQIKKWCYGNMLTN